MLAMALMGFAVGIVLAAIRANAIAQGDTPSTIASLGHFVPAAMFLGFAAVFVGIESPDEETLRAARKGQNTRRDLAESLRTIYSYGIAVNTGYILGFDTESGSVAQGESKDFTVEIPAGYRIKVQTTSSNDVDLYLLMN